jgi:hypothetical protein
MSRSRPPVLIIMFLLGCLGALAAATTGAFLFVIQNKEGILPVTPAAFISPDALKLGISNFYMAKDAKGRNKTTVFATTDDFFVSFGVSGIEVGTSFQSRWYGLDLPDVDPSVPLQTVDYFYEAGVKNVHFKLASDSPWPIGSYKVEIYMNGTKVIEQGFSVQ